MIGAVLLGYQLYELGDLLVPGDPLFELLEVVLLLLHDVELGLHVARGRDADFFVSLRHFDQSLKA